LRLLCSITRLVPPHAVDAEQLLGGYAAKQHNQGGVNQLNLLEEVERGTRRLRVFSAGGCFLTAFDRIGDEETPR
jgi:hypothetical protein